MLDEIKPGSKLAKQLKNLGVWLQNQSSSKSGNVRRTFTDDLGKITITVRPSGVVGMQGYLFAERTDFEIAYGKVSVHMYSRATKRLEYLPKNRAASYISILITRMIPGVPDNVTRDISIHL